MTLNLPQIQYQVEKLAKRIEAPRNILPTFGYSEQSGRPHIEVDSRGYHYVNAERGHEFSRQITLDLDELLYLIFADVTFSLSVEYELANRIENQDGRRIMFPYQVELLSLLSPKWSERESLEHERILRQHPFDDNAGIRATLAGNLRKQGYAEETISKMIYEKYPLPIERA